MKCLLVDDEAGIRDGLAQLLRLKGHDVRTAADVTSALRNLRDDEFDAVITDWRLPDGNAEPVVRAAGCPVFAVSGHPEEIAALPGLQQVLQKPVSPRRILELLASLPPAAKKTSATAEPEAMASLPCDVHDALTAATALLVGQTVEIVDDGTFVVLRAPLPSDDLLPRLELLGGDLRVLVIDEQPTLELRLFRDGRPDADVPVLAPSAAWPAAPELAIDFARGEVTLDAFLTLVDLSMLRARVGDRVHFLNVPGHLRFFAEVSGRGHDMPKRARPGPRLPAVLAQLWS